MKYFAGIIEYLAFSMIGILLSGVHPALPQIGVYISQPYLPSNIQYLNINQLRFYLGMHPDCRDIVHSGVWACPSLSQAKNKSCYLQWDFLFKDHKQRIVHCQREIYRLGQCLCKSCGFSFVHHHPGRFKNKRLKQFCGLYS